MPSKNALTPLAPGTTVWCTDAKAGSLADLVVDPATGEITHLVVEPDARFRQLRLVPMWLVSPGKEGPTVAIDVPHFRLLQRVLETDYVRSDSPITTKSQPWRVRFSTCLSLPYFDVQPAEGHDHELVPIAECAIRRGAVVMSAQGDIAGAVAGFLVRDESVYALIVTTALRGGRRRDVVVPLSIIRGEPGDLVMLPLDAAAVRRLPETTVARHTPDPGWLAHSAHDKFWRSGARLRDKVRTTTHRLRSRQAPT